MKKGKQVNEWMHERINNKWKGYILYVRINELKWRKNVQKIKIVLNPRLEGRRGGGLPTLVFLLKDSYLVIWFGILKGSKYDWMNSWGKGWKDK